MTENNIFYTKNFYNTQKIDSYKSAAEIVPLLIEYFKPKSVLDVGCGMGTWLKSFLDNGVEDILGIDGNYIDVNELLIPKEKFLAKDLRSALELDRQFDLVISLEVAEHLPKESADVFIDSLTNHGAVIYFSAAIPFQGGTNHINEQWQSYWANKFKIRNFIPVDLIRPKIWTNIEVQTCYAQNGILYIRKDMLHKLDPELISWTKNLNMDQLSIVHPNTLEYLVNPFNQTVRNQFKYFLKVLAIRIKNRLTTK